MSQVGRILAGCALLCAIGAPATHAREHRGSEHFQREGDRSDGEPRGWERANKFELRQGGGLGNRVSTGQAGAANLSSITQNGADDAAKITQTGDSNSAFIRQFGRDNAASIAQSGANNIACVIQFGRGLSTDLVQNGDGQSGGILQTRKGSRDIPPSLCAIDTARRGYWMKTYHHPAP